MGVRMVDVSAKEEVYREATAEGLLRLDPGLARVVAREGFVGLGNVEAAVSVASIMAVKRAWEYLPLLHPIPITYSSAEVSYGEDYIKLRVTARTIAQTGVEMDALFGLTIGLITAWNVVKARHCTCGPGGNCEVSPGGTIEEAVGIGDIKGIESIRVVSKVKGSKVVDSQVSDVKQSKAPPLVTLFDASEEPLYRGLAEAVGFIRLREGTIKLIRGGLVEKGDPLSAAQVAAIMVAKRSHELLPLVHQNYVTHVSVGFDVLDGGVSVRVVVKNISRTGSAMEALLAASTALLTIWDMVKKYEKDENGQYPYTEVSYVKLVKSVKVPAQ